jgi:probable HAF family extracellular repeat protein
MKIPGIGATALLCLAFTTESRAQVFTYEIESMSAVEFGTLGGQQSEALDINNTGDMVGWAEQSGGNRHGFLLRNGNTVMQDVTAELGPYPASANGINDLGWVAGQYEPPQGSAYAKAFSWIEGLPLRTLTPDYEYSKATAINSVGYVVGAKFGPVPGNPYSPCDGMVPVRWEATYNWHELLGCQGGAELALATDINNMNLIVGWEDPPGQSPIRAWKYMSNGTLELVPKPDVPTCAMWALGVNNSGTIVGRVTICALWGNKDRAFISKSGITTTLHVLEGGTYSQAREVNDQEFVAGVADKFINGGPLPDAVRGRAFIYHQHFGMVALPLPSGYIGTFSLCGANALTGRESAGMIRIAGYCDKDNKRRAVRWDVSVKKNYMWIPPGAL